jgi:Zn-dependent M16 (insulinase) family peptidase
MICYTERYRNLYFQITTYGVESGGDPAEKPNLTYEQFTNFHKRFYHPSK